MIDSGLRAQIAAFIEATGDGTRDDAARDALLAELAAQQAQCVESYQRFLRSEPRRPGGALPALPTDVFRYARVASHGAERDVRVFRTSGTSNTERGCHAFADLSLYDLAAERAARHALFADRERMKLLVLAPHESDTADSSLSYMLSRFAQWFGLGDTHFFVSKGELQSQALLSALREAARSGEPVALLGTSFAFVHADDAFGTERFELPPGSRIMQTGGFKGRSRSVDPDAMLGMLSARYGVGAEWIVQEYGMTELSSQLYETTLRQAALGLPVQARKLWIPSWVRAEPIDPQTLLPTVPGAVGVLRIDDLANVGSVCAIQTSDLARRQDDGIVVLGRAPGAVARGCSLTFDQWMAAAAERSAVSEP